MTKLRILRSASRCIYENLALEDYIFRNLEEGEETLLLWRNRDCVVIGRYQNPYIECRLGELRRAGISLARRQSGGGTVWHDEGNLCFTFFGSSRGFSRRNNIEITAEALIGLGVPAEINRRLDILAEGCKISGSAFRESRGFAFHHGTILIQANLEKLKTCLGEAGFLCGTEGFGGSKGIRSVVSPVRNTGPYMKTDRPMEAAEAALAETFIRLRSPAAVPKNRGTPALETADPQTIREPAFLAYLEHIQSRDWLYKASPPFSRRCRLGRFDCILDIRGGVIEDLHIAPLDASGGASDGGLTGVFAGKNLDRISAEELRDMLLGRDYEPAIT
jgi:lipoate-protein ligase A